MAGRKGPGRDSTSAKSIEVAKRHAEWMSKRLQGWSYRKIADHYGVQDSTVHEAVTRELKAIRREPAEELKAFELAALERLIEMTLEAVEAGELERVEQLRKLLADRRKLLGLDAAQKLEISRNPEELWASVREWLARPTPELEAALRDAGWTRS